MEKVEDICMELGSLLTESVFDEKLPELKKKVLQLKGLFDKVTAARDEWLGKVDAEVARQKNEFDAAFGSTGLTTPSKPAPAGKKRGPKPKNKDAEANAANEAVALAEEESQYSDEAHLDAE